MTKESKGIFSYLRKFEEGRLETDGGIVVF